MTDLDCDGALDLFLGQITGTVTRYAAAGRDAAGLPRFRPVTNRFEDIEIVARIGSMHGANTLVFHDVDGDGDPDLFWGDFFEPGLLLIENRGSCGAPTLRGDPRPFPLDAPVATSGYNAPAFGDVDGDGDADLVVGVLGGAYNPSRTAADNLYWFERRPDGGFALRTRRFIGALDVGAESVPAPVDVDGDGDVDLVIGNKIDPDDPQTARVTLFRNDGSPTRPAFRFAGPLPFAGHYHFAPAFGDLDGDGDPDLVMGTWRDAVAFYRNDGPRASPRWTRADSALVRLTRGSNATPALGDLDGDGDLDLVIGEGSGALNVYRNVGSAARPAFELVSDAYLGIDVGRRSRPALVDVDGDGDLDLVVGSETGSLALYRNRGGPTAPDFVADGALVEDVPPLAAPAFADLDGDGDSDLLVGGLSGGLVYFEQRAPR
ncbi:MAG: FG-GAP-like repeat-containing protein [Gemmatimonadales bacterium]